MAGKLRGGDPQFSYDFGIAVSTATLSKITRLTGVTLSLAGAYYALQKTATEYVDTLKPNAMRFGGYLNKMQTMAKLQDRIAKGQTSFSVQQQMRGMNDLMSVGIKASENLDFLDKSAHAMGVSFDEFAGAIANGIRGNMSGLVQMGLLTERSTRYFEKYQANTIQRQQAILNFVKEHKGLQTLIKNDFRTIKDGTAQVSGIWKTFMQSVVGDPRNPDSLYGSVVGVFDKIGGGLSKSLEYIKRAGYMVGRVLGWFVKQIGEFVMWVGRVINKSLDGSKKILDNYRESTNSLIVWLEFMKLRVVKFFQDYQEPIKTTLKLLLAYKALKTVFLISKAAINSAWAYAAAINSIGGGLYRGIRRPFIRGKWRTGRMLQNPANYRGGGYKAHGLQKGSRKRRWMYIKNMFMKPKTQTKIAASFGMLKRSGPIIKTISAALLNVGKIGLKGIVGGTLGAILLGFEALKIYIKDILGLSEEWDKSMQSIWRFVKSIGTLVSDAIGRKFEKFKTNWDIMGNQLLTAWNNLVYGIGKTWRDFMRTDVGKMLAWFFGMNKANAAAGLAGITNGFDSAADYINMVNENNNGAHLTEMERLRQRQEETKMLSDISALRRQALKARSMEDISALVKAAKSDFQITINLPEGVTDVVALSDIIIDRLSYEMETKATRNGEIYQPAVLPSIYGNN